MELMDIVFASGQRSLESLCIAFATTDRLSFPAPSAHMQEAADGVIRLLGSRKKLSSHDAPPPQKCRPMSGTTCGRWRLLHAMNPAALESDVVTHLTNCAAINQFILQAPALCLQSGHQLLRVPAMPANSPPSGRRHLYRLLDALRPAAAAHGHQFLRLLQLSRHTDRGCVPPQLRGTDRPNE